MRASLLEATGRLVMIDMPMPEIPRPDWVLIQVKATGICGSEIHAFEGTHPFRKPPAIMGHEISGVIAARGSEVKNFAPGDRVIVDPQWVCGECACCRAGDHNLCPSKKVLGTAEWPGGFGEYVVVPEYTVFPLPDSLSFIEGAMIEPLSVAVHAGRRSGLRAGKSVAVLGTGSIGGMICGVAKAEGAFPIITADIHEHCLWNACENMGASHDFLLPDPHAVTKIKHLTGGDGLDIVFTCADDVNLVQMAMDLVKPKGKVVLVALMTTEPFHLMAYQVIRKEAQVTSTFMGNTADTLRALELAVSGRVNAGAIATHQLPIEQAQYGMELAITKKDKAIKVVLTH